VLKKDITYNNYEGESVTEEYWFHLTKAELLEQNLAHGVGFDEYLKKIVATNDVKRILPIFKEIMTLSVGKQVVGADGKRRFVKNPDDAAAFCSSEAYSELFIEFITDVPSFVEFINNVVPKELSEGVNFETGELKVPEGTATHRQVQIIELPKEPVKGFDDYSLDELLDMSQTEYDKLTGGDPRKMTQPMVLISIQRAEQRKAVKKEVKKED